MKKQKLIKIELHVPKHLVFLEEVYLLTTKFVNRSDFLDKQKQDITQSVLEAACYAIQHGIMSDNEKIHIRFNLEPENITICVIDSGDGFEKNKLKVTKLRKQNTTEKYKGIYTIQKLMDEVDYFSTGVGSVIKMTKHK